MRRETVEQRLMHLVHHNWTAEAGRLIAQGQANGFADPYLRINVSFTNENEANHI